jgi:flavin-dependent dehydrogenase
MDEPDVLIVGGGPAGTALGTLLRKVSGGKLRVTILEGERHPRHHIGESLLPASMPVLEKLSISMREMERRYQPKYGARFYDPPTDRLVTFGFEPVPGSAAPSYQVYRESFDALLAVRAREAGCTLLEGAVVETLDEATGRIHLRDGRTMTGRFLVDATGREALIATRRREKTVLDAYGRIGIYNYFAALPPHDAQDDQYITMYLFEGGWVWLIPLRDGRTSVGVVYRDVPRAAIEGRSSRQESLFWQAVEKMPRLEARLRAAQVTEPFRAIADYSFTVRHKVDSGTVPRWAAVGDAAGFLDPIFSSGVHLALVSANTLAPAIAALLNCGEAALLRAYESHLDAGFAVFRAFVQRFYGRELVQTLFFSENKPPELHAAITRILAGHVWDPKNPVLWLLGVGKDGAAESR